MKKRLIPIVLFLSLVGLGGLSLVSIHNLQGNARVINYTGVVRGATQRLVKEELKGRTDDALIARLDGIMEELATGVGENRLIRLNDQAYQELLSSMEDLDTGRQCKCAASRWLFFPAASPGSRRERKRNRHHQLIEKSWVVGQGVVDVYYA